MFQDRWKFVLGGYYFHEYGEHDDGVPFTGGLIQIYSPNNKYDTKSYAAFMHNNIDIIPDKLGITLGIRYTHDKKTFTGTQRSEEHTSELHSLMRQSYAVFCLTKKQHTTLAN